MPEGDGWVAYFCTKCQFFYREQELIRKGVCPECDGTVKPRMILSGQIIGNTKGE